MPTYHAAHDLRELFVDLHASELFADGKTISDSDLTTAPQEVLAAYRNQRNSPGFDLKSFFDQYFLPRQEKKSDYQSDASQEVEQHIRQLWEELTRRPGKDNNAHYSTRIPLPHPYVVPGGRFNEIYYWDSFFTMLGLRAHGRPDLVKSMVDNFVHLIDTYGHIPNGNRTYFLSRSQPPFFAQMLRLLIADEAEEKLPFYYPALKKEYDFWMNGASGLSDGQAHRRVYRHGDLLLNRYFDDALEPRDEMYQDDVELLERGGTDGEQLLRNIRAACESGWDFSSRWFAEATDMATIQTTDLLPVDLNCLLYDLEVLLSEAGAPEHTSAQKQQYEARAHAIRELFWDADTGYFHDYNWKTKTRSPRFTLAGMFPLYFGIATQEQAASCARVVRERFLQPGGLRTTDVRSGQQWDAPNGWAPLQYIAVRGLKRYGHQELADEIRHRWLELNRAVFRRTGKMMEKYNVEDTTLESGGGEYENQEGFGWTNGVFVAFAGQ